MGSNVHFFRQSSGGGGDAFIATFRTTTANESITLPYSSNGTYSGTIDWGDGTVVANSYANRTHTYVNSGDYDVTVLGELIGFNSVNNPKLINIKQWGTGFRLIDNPTNGGYLYANANLDITAIDAPNLQGITGFNSFFYLDTSLVFNSSINDWDVSSVISMASTFRGCNVFNQPLNDWDVSNVTDMNSIFYDCRQFNQPLNNWDVSNVLSFAQAFRRINVFNQPLNDWDVSSASDMRMMFRDSAFNQPLNNWDVSNVTTMNNMFSYSAKFNQDISSWDFSGLNASNSLSLFFQNRASSSYNSTYYDNLLIKWASDPSLGGLQPNIIGTIDMGSIKYTANGASARASILANNKAQVINDGGQI